MLTKPTHIDLLKLSHTLGYTLSNTGLCQGFSGMLSQAWLAEDEKTFVERLKFIKTYNNDFDQLKKDIDKAREQAKGKPFDALDHTTKKLLEIPAFYEGIELYLNPGAHKHLFASKRVFQGSMGAIYPFARSKKMEKDTNELSIELNKPYSFDKQNLIKYLQDFEEVFCGKDVIAPIVLLSSNHSVCLRYDSKIKKWLYVDTNDFQRYPDSASFTRELDSNSLADSIFISFFNENHSHTVFNTIVLMKSSEEKSLQSALDAFDKKYPIEPEQAKIYDSANAGILYLACQNGCLDVVRELLKQENVNQQILDGVTLLFVACQNGHLDIVRELLKQTSINVNQARNDGITPLHMACQNGHYDIVRELLGHKDIKVNQASNDGITPLHMACQNGHYDIFHELLGLKDIKANPARNNGVTPLHCACEIGHLEIVRDLLKQKGIDVNSARNDGLTPLQNACDSPNNHGKKELFELLLKNGASITQKENGNRTALDFAKRKNNKAAIEAINRSAKEKEKAANELHYKERLRSAAIRALSDYTYYHQNSENKNNKLFNRRQGAGVFSWLRHGTKDLDIAKEFKWSFSNNLDRLSLIEAIIKMQNFLEDSSRTYHYHSFATYLADALCEQGFISSHRKGRYDQKQVVKI